MINFLLMSLIQKVLKIYYTNVPKCWSFNLSCRLQCIFIFIYYAAILVPNTISSTALMYYVATFLRFYIYCFFNPHFPLQNNFVVEINHSDFVLFIRTLLNIFLSTDTLDVEANLSDSGRREGTII